METYTSSEKNNCDMRVLNRGPNLRPTSLNSAKLSVLYPLVSIIDPQLVFTILLSTSFPFFAKMTAPRPQNERRQKRGRAYEIGPFELQLECCWPFVYPVQRLRCVSKFRRHLTVRPRRPTLTRNEDETGRLANGSRFLFGDQDQHEQVQNPPHR